MKLKLTDSLTLNAGMIAINRNDLRRLSGFRLGQALGDGSKENLRSKNREAGERTAFSKTAKR